MGIKFNVEDRTLVISPVEKLDASIEQEATEIVNNNIGDVDNVVFDMTGVEYMSSAGIRVIVTTIKALAGKGDVKVKNANEEIMEVFDIVGMKNILNFE